MPLTRNVSKCIGPEFREYRCVLLVNARLMLVEFTLAQWETSKVSGVEDTRYAGTRCGQYVSATHTATWFSGFQRWGILPEPSKGIQFRTSLPLEGGWGVGA